MKTDLQMFVEQGVEHQEKLSQMALQACYWSALYQVPFMAWHLIEDAKDQLSCDYLDGYLHAVCLAQDRKISCSRFIAITPMFRAVDWYLCSFYANELTDSRTLVEDIKGKFDILKHSYTTNVNHIFRFTNAFNIEQVSLNDDICLYTILSAYRKGVHHVPLQILLSLTPKYSMIQALGFVEGLHMSLGDDFNCSMNITGKTIDVSSINAEYFKEYTRENLTKKYERNNMFLEELFENIEMQMDYIKVRVKISRFEN